MKSFLLTLPLFLACACSRNDSNTHAADNTARNDRDKSGTTLTPLDQGESEADRTVTQKVRQTLMDDSALSTNAKNIKVITINGKVTLRGVVESQDEKNTIDMKVRTVAGVNECDNQLEIKS